MGAGERDSGVASASSDCEERTPESGTNVDPDALLVALVLVPHSYPRNRFYDLYKTPALARVRRRAALIRSLVADVVGEAEEVRLRLLQDGYLLRYRIGELDLARQTRLTEDELALLVLSARRGRAVLPPCFDQVDEHALQRVRGRLERLFR